MKLKIGDKIKALRRGRDITQDEFASIIGVSYQSVSRWENGICYPDMELLPAIADFFGVTVDSLLCVNEAIEKEHVQSYLDEFQKAISIGKIYDCIEIARHGVAEYPNNYTLLNKLMYALFVSGDSDGNIPEWEENMKKNDEEITAIGERIMKYCPDQDIRLEATARLAFNHCEMGRMETARAIYETLPTQKYCRENQIWWSIPEEKTLSFLHNKVKQDYDLLRSSMWLLASAGGLSPEEAIAVYNKVSELERIAYEEGNTPDMWGAAKLPVELAEQYMKSDNTDKAIECLYKAAEAAKAFDNRPEKQEYSSLLFGRIERNRTDFETSDSRPLCEIMRDKWLLSGDFDKIRDLPYFTMIIDSLS